MNCKNCGYGLKQRCGDFEKIICTYEEGECVKITELEAQIEKMKRCEICKHYQLGSCNYHSNWVKDCRENGMKLFEIKEITEK